MKPFEITPEMFNEIHRNTVLEVLDISVLSVDAEHLTLRMPITNAARQPLGLLHGGVSMVLAESAASSHAAWGLDMTKEVPVGIEINGSHLNSASDGHVLATARPIRRSRSLVVHQIEVVHEESGRLLCTARVTNFFKQLKQKDASPS